MAENVSTAVVEQSIGNLTQRVCSRHTDEYRTQALKVVAERGIAIERRAIYDYTPVIFLLIR